MGSVLRVDGWKSGWVGALLDGTGICFEYREALEELVTASPQAEAVVVDVPIGMPEQGRRVADVEAKRFVGGLHSAVFMVPPEAVLRAPDYQQALALSKERFGFGISAQAFSLRHKIFEADEVARADSRVFEGHPEVSFTALNRDDPLDYTKRTWNGQQRRRNLLVKAGIRIGSRLPEPVARAPADDVLDAAVMAWTARRIVQGEAESLPDPPEEVGGREVAIWY